MAYKLAIFDLDGTLLDTLDDLAYSVNFALALNGFETRGYGEVKGFLGYGARNLIKSALPEGCGDETVDKVLTDFRAHYVENSMNSTKPYGGIAEALSALRGAGIRTAVLSNKPDPSVAPLCEHYFPSLIDLAAGEKPEIPRKPAPDGVTKILEHFGIDKSEAVFIGDSETDVETAKNAGLDVIAVTWGFRDIPCLKSAGATMLADDAATLAKMIIAGGNAPEPAAPAVIAPTASTPAAVPAAVQAAVPAKTPEVKPALNKAPAEKAAGIILGEMNPVAEAGKTGLFAAANILFLINTILTFILTVVIAIFGSAGIIGISMFLFESFGIGTDTLEAFVAPFADSAPLVALIIGGMILFVSIPTLLINIGAFMTRSACKHSEGGRVKAGGLKVIRAAVIIEAAAAALVSAASLILSVVLTVTDEYMSALGISSILFAAVTTLVMAFIFAKLLDSLTNAIDTANGYHPKKASTLLGILTIVAAVFGISNLILCISLIFYAVTLFRYNGKVNKYISSENGR